MKKLFEMKNKYLYIAVCMYFLAALIPSTMFINNQIVFSFSKILRYFTYCIFLVLGLQDYFLDYRTIPKMKRQRDKSLIISAVGIGIVTIISRNTLLAIISIILLAVRKKKFDEILVNIFYVNVGFFLLTIVLNVLKVLPDVVIYREVPRFSMGYVYPLELTGHFLFIVLMFCYIKQEGFVYQHFIVIQIINLLLFKIAAARTSFLLIFVVSLLFLKWKYIKEKIVNFLTKINLTYFSAFFIITIFLVPILLSIVYCEEYQIFKFLDGLLSNRISLAAAAFEDYDVTLFGEKIAWVGFGNSYDPESLKGVYNFIDCSYVRYLFDYGVIGYVIIGYGYFQLIKKLCMQKKIAGLVVIIIALLFSFMELRLLHLAFNPFILMLTTDEDVESICVHTT